MKLIYRHQVKKCGSCSNSVKLDCGSVAVQWLSSVKMVDVTKLVLNVCIYHIRLQFSHCIICSAVCCKVLELIENESRSSLIEIKVNIFKL